MSALVGLMVPRRPLVAELSYDEQALVWTLLIESGHIPLRTILGTCSRDLYRPLRLRLRTCFSEKKSNFPDVAFSTPQLSPPPLPDFSRPTPNFILVHPSTITLRAMRSDRPDPVSADFRWVWAICFCGTKSCPTVGKRPFLSRFAENFFVILLATSLET